MVGQEIASINSKINTVITEMNSTTKRIAKIEQGLQTDKQQTQLTESLQKLEIESLNSKKLGRHLYDMLRDFIYSFIDAHLYQNFNEIKRFIREEAELLKNQLEQEDPNQKN